MRRLGRHGLALALVAAAFATSAALYGSLPAVIPTHWNGQGAVDGWMPRPQGAFFGPCSALVIVAVLILLEPRATEKGPGTLLKGRIYAVIVVLVSGLMFFVNLSVLMAGRGRHLAVP